MAVYIVPADTFFKASPEIRIRYIEDEQELAQFVIDTHAKEDRIPEVDSEIDCFLRKASDDERDGHLARLQGVQRMHAFLCRVRQKAEVDLFQHGERVGWEIMPDEHPCGMLSYNDKCWRLKWDDKYLRRYGDRRREQSSCIPPQLRSSAHIYAVEHCLYCNGQYDKKVETELGLKTSRADTVDGPWTE
ncbi:hypothetical protein C8A03DRAFT_38975 [Achaetomium macrosporum]|uniref:Uncharacterized protein n=1 Tax=Achaetomium macrosporum TaxID=79813 RepID=A0AAN7C0Y7_9PEZI|nr:hypothetical protein C8A03DRAFT_38975 [Achaetomium macrosporum]